jgi:transposase InsO family protein
VSQVEGRAAELARLVDAHGQLPRPLGDAQQPLRAAEQAARSAAAQLVGDGHAQSTVAGALHLAPQTLGAWLGRPVEEPVPRGRPPAPLDPIDRLAVTERLDSVGRSIAVPALKQLFPQVPRAALRDLRDDWIDEQRCEPSRLIWTAAGAAWSADFTEVPMPIDGMFPCVLLVRDLASLAILLAAPCLAMTADTAGFHFRQLFAQHGAPLVLKTDNGSAFIAGDTREIAQRHGVVNLLSPPMTPRYNGSIEATAGTLKTRAAIIAQQQSCDIWTSDILESARLAANALNWPRGPSAPTPDEYWLNRAPIGQSQRVQLAALIAERTDRITQSIQRERQEKGLAAELTAACRATVVRTAIRQALVELGYLQIRRPANMSTESSAILSRN